MYFISTLKEKTVAENGGFAGFHMISISCTTVTEKNSLWRKCDLLTSSGGLVIDTLRVEIQIGFLAFWSGSHRACVLVILDRSSNVSSILHFCLLLYLPAGRTHKYTRDILMINILFLSLSSSFLTDNQPTIITDHLVSLTTKQLTPLMTLYHTFIHISSRYQVK